MPRVRIRSDRGEAWLTVNDSGTCTDAHPVLLPFVAGLSRPALRALIARNGWQATLIHETPPAATAGGVSVPPGPMDHPLVRVILAAFPGADVTVTQRASPLLADDDVHKEQEQDQTA